MGRDWDSRYIVKPFKMESANVVGKVFESSNDGNGCVDWWQLRGFQRVRFTVEQEAVRVFVIEMETGDKKSVAPNVKQFPFAMDILRDEKAEVSRVLLRYTSNSTSYGHVLVQRNFVTKDPDAIGNLVCVDGAATHCIQQAGACHGKLGSRGHFHQGVVVVEGV